MEGRRPSRYPLHMTTIPAPGPDDAATHRAGQGALARLPAVAWLLLAGVACTADAAGPASSFEDSGGRSPLVDGHLEDWPAALRIDLSDAAPVSVGRAAWKGPADLSGVVLLTYDADYLYVGARVTTGTPAREVRPQVDPCDGDGLDVWINLDAPERLESYTRGSQHFKLSASGEAPCSVTRHERVPGARFAVDRQPRGYVLEAAIPLAAFPGASIHEGGRFALDVAIHSGGAGQGLPEVVISASGSGDSELDVDRWQAGTLGGSVTRTVPGTPRVYADGTDGARLLDGAATLRGRVADPDGRGLGGVRVAMWPSSVETATDADGRFTLHGARVYDRSVVTARKDGWYSTLAAWDHLGAIRLAPLPDLSERVPPFLFGHNYWMWRGDSPVDRAMDNVKTLGLRMLRFGGEAQEAGPDEAYADALERFMAFTKAIGAEPYVEVPVHNGSPERSAALVRRARERGWRIRYWSVGNEEDIQWNPEMSAEAYADLVRRNIIAMKLEDPDILVAAGELSWRYQSGVDDWVTPLVEHNADLLNFFSIHRYLYYHEADQTVENVVSGSDRNARVFAHVQGLIDQASDVHIPLLVTEANVGSTGDPHRAQGPAGPNTFWAGYTVAQLYGIGMKLRIPTVMPWSLAEGWTLGAIDDVGPKPSFYGAQMVASEFGDIPEDDVAADNPTLRVYATRHSTDGSWAVLVLNPRDAPQRGALKLGERHLTRTFAPESITLLRAGADGGTRALVYTEAMAEARLPPAWAPVERGP